MTILAIETSCDDSGIAVITGQTTNQPPKVLVNLVSSQIKIHAKWGGVVPMLAKREHQRNLTPLLKTALQKSGLAQKPIRRRKNQPTASPSEKIILEEIFDRESTLVKKLIPFLEKCPRPEIDYLAVTRGPGLEPALWVGVNFARLLSRYWAIPILPINHLEGHLIAAFADGESRGLARNLFPAIGLIVSGGHTQLVLIKKMGQYEIIGETRDDAAGEAFDKVAKMLGLGYPGGPIISKIADKFRSSKKIKPQSTLPRPMINSGDFDFSFSGLKTAVLYQLQKMTPTQIKKNLPAVAAEFEQAVIDVITKKTAAAAKKYQARSLWLSGGVAANKALRQSLSQTASQNNWKFLSPSNDYCTDNGAMIGLAACLKLQNGQVQTVNWQKLTADSNLRIS